MYSKNGSQEEASEKKSLCARTQGTEAYKLYSERQKDSQQTYSQHLVQNKFTLFDKLKLCGFTLAKKSSSLEAFMQGNTMTVKNVSTKMKKLKTQLQKISQNY